MVQKELVDSNGVLNPDINPENYCDNEKYLDHFYAQYKMAVDSALMAAERREGANRFYLTLHTFVLAAIGISYKYQDTVGPPELILVALSGAIILCVVWFLLLRSYRQLNGVKFRMIGKFEEKLPASPWKAEWRELGYGKDKRKYWPFTQIEQFTPVAFLTVYFCSVAATVFRSILIMQFLPNWIYFVIPSLLFLCFIAVARKLM